MSQTKGDGALGPNRGGHGHSLRVSMLLFGSAGMFFKIFFDSKKISHPRGGGEHPHSLRKTVGQNGKLTPGMDSSGSITYI